MLGVMIIASVAKINNSNILKLCRVVSTLLKKAFVRFRFWARTPGLCVYILLCWLHLAVPKAHWSDSPLVLHSLVQ